MGDTGCCDHSMFESGPATRFCPPRCVSRAPIRNIPRMECPEYREYPSYCSVVRRYSTMTYCPAPAPPRWKAPSKYAVCQPLCYGPYPCKRKSCAGHCGGQCCNSCMPPAMRPMRAPYNC